MSAIPTLTTTRQLSITVSQFASFATPAITVPFPSAYAQTQIPFSYAAVATFAATRIPTTYGGVAATSGISSALSAAGSQFGQSANGGGGNGGWPTWATAVIAACGGVALIILGLGLWCWCTRGRRRERRLNKAAARVGNGGGKKALTEKHTGGGAARARSQQDQRRMTGAGGAGSAAVAGYHHPRSSRSHNPYPPQAHQNSPHRASLVPYPGGAPLDAHGRPLQNPQQVYSNHPNEAEEYDPFVAYPRDSHDLPSGYRTPELEAPEFGTGSGQDSPARLWNASTRGEGETPRSSMSDARRGRG